MSESDSLLTEVESWLAERGRAHDALTALAGDVSPRRYLRVRLGQTSSIVAFYPESMREAGARFLKTTEMLSAAGVPVPGVIDWDAERGLMLLRDAGRLAVHDAVGAGAKAMRYWSQAVPLLDRLAGLNQADVAEVNSTLDARTLRRELVQSWDLVLEPGGLVGEDSLSEDLRWGLFALCDRLAEAEPRPCHRDFMARNLLLDSDDEIVVIDHQDLRLGPPWYDLASLLNDTLYAGADEEAALLDQARVPRPEREAYHRAAAQRALKIVGTFAAFASRGVDRYLPLIPHSLASAARHLARLPETGPIMRDLAPSWDEARKTT